MQTSFKLSVTAVLSALLFSVPSLAQTIPEIQSAGFNSPYANKQVTDVSGVVTAIGPQGFWLRSTTPDNDDRTSDSVYVFTGASATSMKGNVKVGETITIDGKVEEYRSSKDFLYLTEITGPKNLRKSDMPLKEVKPVQLGKDRMPPSQFYSALDTNNDIFAVPNNASLIETSGLTLEPTRYGLDFWESLEGELVTVKRPTALSKPNTYGDTWIRGGDWKVTGQNRRGGLTIVAGSNGVGADANPESILIGEPLDGTKNPVNTRLGDSLDEITGVVSYAFGFYRILPTTALNVRKMITPATPNPTVLKSDGRCYITFGSYNVENLEPKSAHLPDVAAQIVDYMKTPDIVYLQEVQDDNGPTNNGVVSADATLAALSAAIFELSGVKYSYVDVDPVNGKDGGQPGGNIRTAYFYNPAVLRLAAGTPGGSTEPIKVLSGGALNVNPGRIDPTNSAFNASRKPLVAMFEPINIDDRRRTPFYAINIHAGSKGGSSSTHGDARPPVNGGVADRTAQATAVRKFVEELVAEKPDANVVIAGDFNEFSYVAPMKVFEGLLYDLDEVVGIKPEERYSYLFDGNSQQLDHTLVTKGLTERARFEHIHVNTWATKEDEVSDHDPSVAKLAICHY